MGFRTQKISDYGSNNPIVARLSLQSQDLVQFYNLSEEQRKKIFELMFSYIQPRLLKCFRIKEQLKKEVRGHQEKVNSKGLERQSDGSIFAIPGVNNLNNRIETFVHSGFFALRDLVKLFSIVFSKEFDNKARYNEVTKWAIKEYGERDPLARFLKDNHDVWIKNFVTKRNAIEHPDDRAGIMHIENFTLIETVSSILLIEPLWYLDDDEKSPIVHDMEVYVNYILRFSEELLIACLEKKGKIFPMVIREIPEDQRNQDCPMRFKMSID